MTPDEKEAFYDKEIAPKLLQIGKLCMDNELSIVCAVEYNPAYNEYGSTTVLQKGASQPMRQARTILVQGSHIQSAIKISG